MEEENELIALRRKKLDAIEAEGIEPFGAGFEVGGSIAEVRAQFKEGETLRAAGRITAHRDMGKSHFLDLRDATGRIQINLNAASGVAQIQEVALAHVAMGRDAARRTKSLAFFELRAHLRNRSAYLKTCPEGLDAFRLNRIEFFAPQGDQFIFFLHRWNIVGRLGRTPILFNWRFTERSGGDACDTDGRAAGRVSGSE